MPDMPTKLYAGSFSLARGFRGHQLAELRFLSGQAFQRCLDLLARCEFPQAAADERVVRGGKPLHTGDQNLSGCQRELVELGLLTGSG